MKEREREREKQKKRNGFFKEESHGTTHFNGQVRHLEYLMEKERWEELANHASLMERELAGRYELGHRSFENRLERELHIWKEGEGFLEADGCRLFRFWQLYARSLKHTDKTAQAKRAYEKALQYNPENAACWLDLASLNKEEPDAFLDCVQMGARTALTGKDLARSHRYLALHFDRQRLYRPAILCLLASLVHEPHSEKSLDHLEDLLVLASGQAACLDPEAVIQDGLRYGIHFSGHLSVRSFLMEKYRHTGDLRYLERYNDLSVDDAAFEEEAGTMNPVLC